MCSNYLLIMTILSLKKKSDDSNLSLLSKTFRCARAGRQTWTVSVASPSLVCATGPTSLKVPSIKAHQCVLLYYEEVQHSSGQLVRRIKSQGLHGVLQGNALTQVHFVFVQ